MPNCHIIQNLNKMGEKKVFKKTCIPNLMQEKKKKENTIRPQQKIIYKGHRDVLQIIPNASDFYVL